MEGDEVHYFPPPIKCTIQDGFLVPVEKDRSYMDGVMDGKIKADWVPPEHLQKLTGDNTKRGKARKKRAHRVAFPMNTYVTHPLKINVTQEDQARAKAMRVGKSQEPGEEPAKTVQLVEPVEPVKPVKPLEPVVWSPSSLSRSLLQTQCPSRMASTVKRLS